LRARADGDAIADRREEANGLVELEGEVDDGGRGGSGWASVRIPLTMGIGNTGRNLFLSVSLSTWKT
jgi:hypothetical protein